MDFKFARFRRENFLEYKSWYNDADLNKWLGPMDDDWIDYVLSESDGIEYAVYKSEEMIAVIGFKFPTSEYPAYFITDFAIKPSMRSKGIGSMILQELVELHQDMPWYAFIDAANTRVISFFEKNNWKRSSTEPDEHGMLAFKLDR